MNVINVGLYFAEMVTTSLVQAEIVRDDEAVILQRFTEAVLVLLVIELTSLNYGLSLESFLFLLLLCTTRRNDNSLRFQRRGENFPSFTILFSRGD